MQIIVNDIFKKLPLNGLSNVDLILFLCYKPDYTTVFLIIIIQYIFIN